MAQGVSGKRRFLLRFKYGCDKDMTLDQLATMTVEKSPMTEEAKVTTIYVITDENIYLEK